MALLLSVGVPVRGQAVTGTILGTVTNDAGGITVTIRNVGTDLTRTSAPT